MNEAKRRRGQYKEKKRARALVSFLKDLKKSMYGLSKTMESLEKSHACLQFQRIRQDIESVKIELDDLMTNGPKAPQSYVPLSESEVPISESDLPASARDQAQEMNESRDATDA